MEKAGGIMRLAADFRKAAREALTGKWLIAVLAGVIAMLLGAVENMGPEVEFNLESSNVNLGLSFAGQQIFSTGGSVNSGIGKFLAGSFIYFMIAAVALAVFWFVLGGIIEVGYRKFQLNLIDQNEEKLENLFEYFAYWKNMTVARLLRTIYVFLWTLLFIIPGIIAEYNYAMTPYILAENPEMPAGEAIRRSKEMMMGNKWRLFCLHISFIGWKILCAFTLGIGSLWLVPYENAAEAFFYREISGTERIINEGIEWTVEQ